MKTTIIKKTLRELEIELTGDMNASRSYEGLTMRFNAEENTEDEATIMISNSSEEVIGTVIYAKDVIVVVDYENKDAKVKKDSDTVEIYCVGDFTYMEFS